LVREEETVVMMLSSPETTLRIGSFAAFRTKIEEIGAVAPHTR
jgi:hypothetical protein